MLLLILLINKAFILNALRRAKIAKRNIVPCALIPLLNSTIIRTSIKGNGIIIITFFTINYNSVAAYRLTSIWAFFVNSRAIPSNFEFTVLITAITILGVTVVAFFDVSSDAISAFGCADVN
jgi:hypothetical protein